MEEVKEEAWKETTATSEQGTQRKEKEREKSRSHLSLSPDPLDLLERLSQLSQYPIVRSHLLSSGSGCSLELGEGLLDLLHHDHDVGVPELDLLLEPDDLLARLLLVVPSLFHSPALEDLQHLDGLVLGQQLGKLVSRELCGDSLDVVAVLPSELVSAEADPGVDFLVHPSECKSFSSRGVLSFSELGEKGSGDDVGGEG